MPTVCHHLLGFRILWSQASSPGSLDSNQRFTDFLYPGARLSLRPYVDFPVPAYPEIPDALLKDSLE